MPSKRNSRKSASSKPSSVHVWGHSAKLPIERVTIVGAGGNGSIFLTHLCRIHQAWVKLGGKPFEITIVDPDTVSDANLARQVFCEADLGQPKALVLAQRCRAFFGINVRHEIRVFKDVSPMEMKPNIIVGCVDSIATRRCLKRAIRPRSYTRHQWGEDTKEKHEGLYWLDLGNSEDSGQIVLGGHGLPDLFDVLPQMARMRDPKHLPSCSMAESLSRQNLFINSTLATLAGHLLWQLMRKGGLNHHGYFVNLQSGRVAPIEIK